MTKSLEQVFLDTKAIFEKQAAEAVQEAMNSIYTDYLPHVEADNYYNVRQSVIGWLERFMADCLTDDDVSIVNITQYYSGKAVRQKIFNDNKEELTKSIGADIVQRVMDLESRMSYANERKYG